jgi:hypothetical protein
MIIKSDHPQYDRLFDYFLRKLEENLDGDGLHDAWLKVDGLTLQYPAFLDPDHFYIGMSLDIDQPFGQVNIELTESKKTVIDNLFVHRRSKVLEKRERERREDREKQRKAQDLADQECLEYILKTV